MSKVKTVINASTGEVENVSLSEEEQSSIDSISTESAEIQAREKRNMLLKESDWRVLPHSPSDVEAWATYRQQLRDLPADPAWPNAEFPTPPEAN